MEPMWIAVALALALVVLAVWSYRRSRLRSSGRDDRYMPERILTPEQVVMLDYLRDTFPNQVVLPNMALKNLLSVRRSSDHRRAMERLSQHEVDFVVCGEDGRPQFAFDIEQYHLSDAKAKMDRLKLKNRILKSAGVRFLFLKDGIHRMPSPADFRKQLNLASLPQPKRVEDPAAEARQLLDSKFSQFDQLYPANGFRDSEVMGMSHLMDLEDEAAPSPAPRSPSPRTRMH